MTAKLTFHLPPDARPAAVGAMLGVLAARRDEPVTRADLLDEMTARMAETARGEAIKLADDLGLIQASGRGITSSERGRAIERSGAIADLVHGLQYGAWHAQQPARLSRFWTYRAAVDRFWAEAPVKLTPALKKTIVEDLLAQAEAAFGGVAGFAAERTSIGPKTLDGVLRWLEQLAPAVAVAGRLERRRTCPPLLVVQLLRLAARLAGAVPGTDFRLASEQRELITRGCFLEPEALDQILDWTVQTQPHLVRWGTSLATYGRQVVLTGTDPWPA